MGPAREGWQLHRKCREIRPQGVQYARCKGPTKTSKERLEVF